MQRTRTGLHGWGARAAAGASVDALNEPGDDKPVVAGDLRGGEVVRHVVDDDRLHDLDVNLAVGLHERCTSVAKKRARQLLKAEGPLTRSQPHATRHVGRVVRIH